MHEHERNEWNDRMGGNEIFEASLAIEGFRLVGLRNRINPYRAGVLASEGNIFRALDKLNCVRDRKPHFDCFRIRFILIFVNPI